LTPQGARSLRASGLSLNFYATYYTGTAAVFGATWTSLALILLLRNSSDRIALIAALSFVGFGCSLFGTLDAPTALGYNWAPLAQVVNNLGFLSLFVLLYVSPDGRFIPRWTRWVTVAGVVETFGSAFSPRSPLNADHWPGPLVALPFAVILLSAIFAQIYRYRRVSDPVQRQQTKLIVLGLTVSLGTFFLWTVIAATVPSIGADGSPSFIAGRTVVTTTLLLIPISFGVAILRYRLWDVGLLVNRTLVYGSLTASLVAVYIGGVVLLQALLRALSGQSSGLAVAISTLTIAALFQPFRRHIQTFIDRRFYRRKYDATQTLAAFSTRLRDDLDLDQLSRDLVHVVEETVQPAHASIWIKPL